MTSMKLNKSVGYCGLICSLCSQQKKNCENFCKDGGGDISCFQKKCCAEKQIEGCWECEEFPCKKGIFSHESKFKCITIASCQGLRDVGIQDFVNCVSENLGDTIAYSDYVNEENDFI